MSALDAILKSRGIHPDFARAAAGRGPVQTDVSAGKRSSVTASPDSPPIYYYDVIQGTAEWKALRAGIPTASNFDKIVTPGGKKGIPDRSKSAEDYMRHLCAERLLGEPVDGFKGRAMARGNEKEPEALNSYQFKHDVEIKACGFVTTADGRIGASPDGLVDEDGIVEIKCPEVVAIHMGYLLQSGSPYESYKVQCQGQLWVMQREWSDVLSYYPGLPKAETRIYRDESFIAAMAPLIEEFCVNLGELYTQCIAKGWAKEAPKPKGKPFSQANVIDAMRSAMIEAQK